MSYNYTDQLNKTSTENGLCLMARTMTSIAKLKKAGRVYASIEEIINLDATSTWDTLMCIENLLKNAFLKEVTYVKNCAAQDRVVKI